MAKVRITSTVEFDGLTIVTDNGQEFYLEPTRSGFKVRADRPLFVQWRGQCEGEVMTVSERPVISPLVHAQARWLGAEYLSGDGKWVYRRWNKWHRAKCVEPGGIGSWHEIDELPDDVVGVEYD